MTVKQQPLIHKKIGHVGYHIGYSGDLGMALGFGVFAISGWDFRLSSAAGLELRIHRGVKLRVQILCLKVRSRACASELNV